MSLWLALTWPEPSLHIFSKHHVHASHWTKPSKKCHPLGQLMKFAYAFLQHLLTRVHNTHTNTFLPTLTSINVRKFSFPQFLDLENLPFQRFNDSCTCIVLPTFCLHHWHHQILLHSLWTEKNISTGAILYHSAIRWDFFH